MTPAAAWIWLVTLIVVTVVVVPLALYLLHRLYTAARNIDIYIAESLEAGAGIANNTVAVVALDDTINVATSLLEATEILETKSAELSTLVAGPVTK